MTLPAPLEDYEQRVIAQYLDARKLLWTHVPMGGHRHRAVAAQLRSHGAKAGCPDVVIFTPPPLLHGIVGVAIEMKRRNGTLSDISKAQQAWLWELKQVGWKTAVCFGADRAIEFVESLYGK